jgi:phage gp45-like
MTNNSHEPPNAVKGNVYENGTSVTASGEYRSLRACMPYGIASIPPKNECAVVLPLEDGEVSLGVLADTDGLQEGELMLSSAGGASIVLKNDGRVLINGREI